MPAWVQTLPKEQVAQILAQHGIDNDGSLELLRRRLRRFVDQRPELFPARAASTTAMAKQDDEDIPVVPPITLIERTKILNQIRKWGHQFDGRDPLSFLERIEELRRGYGYEDEQLLLGLPELLKGDALLWYRNHQDAWTTWADFCRAFKNQFLPADFTRRTRREVTSQYQQPGETFAAYSTVLLTLMRRAGGYTDTEKLDQLYENLDPELQLHIRRDEVRTVEDLSSRAAHIEAI